VAISVCAYVFYVLWAPEEIANRGEALALVLAALVLGLFANLLAAPIAAHLEYRYLAIARLVSTGLGIGAGLGLTAYGFGELALVGRDACAALVLLLLCGWRSGPWVGCRANRQGITRLLHFAKGLWALNVAERMVLRLDYALVGVLFEKDVLGTYFVVRGIVEGMLGFLVNPVQTVLFAHYCKGEAQGINAMLDRRRMVLLYMAACLGIAILAWLVGPAILDRFIGLDYGGAGVLLPPLVFYAGAVLWFENEKVLAMSRNQHHRVVYARLLQMAIYLALVGPATEYLGLLGAAIATALAGGVLAMAARPASKMKHG
jgi:O-antigen/teichoic acid export membrane protein